MSTIRVSAPSPIDIRGFSGSAALLRSQFDILEPVGADERGVVVDISQDVDAIDTIVDTFLVASGAASEARQHT